jgi:ribonuclease HII
MASPEEVREAIRASTPGCLVGSDEVGLGAYAGELVTCAIAVPCDWDPQDPLVRDSKTLSPAQREKTYEKWWSLAQREQGQNLVISLGIIEVEELNTYPIHDCLKRAHRDAVSGTYWRLPCLPIVIVDGIIDPELEEGLTYAPKVFCLPKADSLVPAVALASIIAKVTRDRMMVEWDKQYPEYGFDKSMGYGTKYHAEALKKYGPCPIHRRQYSPVAAVIREQEQVACREPDIFDLMEEIERNSRD